MQLSSRRNDDQLDSLARRTAMHAVAQVLQGSRVSPLEKLAGHRATRVGLEGFPLGSYVKIGPKPTDTGVVPTWVPFMDVYVDTIGVVVGADTSNNFLYVYCLTADAKEPQQLVFAPARLAAAADVSAERRAQLAAADVYLGRQLVKHFFHHKVSHNSAASLPAGTLVCANAPGSASALGIVMYRIDDSPNDVAVVNVWPVCSIKTIAVRELSAVTADQFAVVPRDQRVRLIEMHGFVKHKFEREAASIAKSVPTTFASLPWPADAPAAEPSRKRAMSPTRESD